MTAMANVTVELPSMLSSLLSTEPTIPVQAKTLREALDRLAELAPGARTHLYDERGNLRQHVLCFHNQTNTRWLESLDVTLADGDTITIIQAVSGG